MSTKEMIIEDPKRVWRITLEEDGSGDLAYTYMDFDLKKGHNVYHLDVGAYVVGRFHDSKDRYFVLVNNTLCKVDGIRLSMIRYSDFEIIKEYLNNPIEQLAGMFDDSMFPKSEEFPEFLKVVENKAIWLHDKYTEFALEEGWKVQEGTDGSWDSLPVKNKRVMLRLAKLLHDIEIENIIKGR